MAMMTCGCTRAHDNHDHSNTITRIVTSLRHDRISPPAALISLSLITAQFAANNALITTLFKTLNKGGDHAEGAIDVDELAAAFEPAFEPEAARHMAMMVVREGSVDGDDSLGPKEMIAIMGNDLVNLEALLKSKIPSADNPMLLARHAKNQSKSQKAKKMHIEMQKANQV